MNSRCVYLATLLFIAVSTRAQTSQSSLIVDLGRPETTKQAAAALLERAKAQADFRNQLSEVLPTFLAAPINKEVTLSEAHLAGSLRIVSTIPALIQLLDRSDIRVYTPTTMTSRYELEDDPVGRALADIGAPAVPALAAPLESPLVGTRERTASILVLIHTPECFALLKHHVDRETDSSLKSYIQANLSMGKRLKYY